MPEDQRVVTERVLPQVVADDQDLGRITVLLLGEEATKCGAYPEQREEVGADGIDRPANGFISDREWLGWPMVSPVRSDRGQLANLRPHRVHRRGPHHPFQYETLALAPWHRGA